MFLSGVLSIPKQMFMLAMPLAIMTFIKTHDSESRGQEEAQQHDH